MRRTKELLPWDSSRYLGLGQEQRKGQDGRGRGEVVVLDHSRAYPKWRKREGGWRGGMGRKGMNRARWTSVNSSARCISVGLDGFTREANNGLDCLEHPRRDPPTAHFSLGEEPQAASLTSSGRWLNQTSPSMAARLPRSSGAWVHVSWSQVALLPP